jgi:hypothetical protein
MINLGYHEFYPKEFLQIFTTKILCLDPLKSFASKIWTYLGYHEFDTQWSFFKSPQPNFLSWNSIFFPTKGRRRLQDHHHISNFQWHFGNLKVSHGISNCHNSNSPKPKIELKYFSQGKKEEIFFDFIFPIKFSTTKT